ncbi:E4 protein [Papillomaviridae sp. Haddock_c45]|nr:E4 protein [Papillomaviridae sp. Haddock_c45]
MTTVGQTNGGYTLPDTVVTQMQEMLELAQASHSMGDQVDGLLPPVHFHLSEPARARIKLLLKGLQQLLLDQINYPYEGVWGTVDLQDSSPRRAIRRASASLDRLKPSKGSDED